MHWGTVVWFEDHLRPFLVTDKYCDNPDCTCNEVEVTFQEISEYGVEVPKPILLRLRIDLATWTECAPPDRCPRAAQWVRRFLSEFPADRRAEMKARSDNARQSARRIATFTIDPAEVIKGILFPYTDLLSDRNALTTGGISYMYLLVHQGHEYLIEDLYCPNPTCDCREFHLQFWFRGRQKRDGVEKVITQ